MVGFVPVMKLTAIVVAVALLLTGCIFNSGDEPGDAAVDTRLYLGPIPAPAPLPALGAQPEAPTPPTDVNDQAAMEEYIAAVEEYAAQMQNLDQPGGPAAFQKAVFTLGETARQGGAQAVAAWQSLLVASGIAVAGHDGAPIIVNGSVGSGWPVTDAELRILALMGTSNDGMRLVDLAETLEGIPDLAGRDVAEDLYDDLLHFSGVDLGFDAFMNALNPSYLVRDMEMIPIDEVVLTWGQVGLVLRRLSAELLTVTGAITAEPAASTGVRMQPAALTTASASSADKQACAIETGSPWTDELLKAVVKAHSVGFDSVLDPYIAKISTKVGMAAARLVLAFLAVVVKAFALEADFSMSDSPLVRTKRTQPGEVRDLTIDFEFNSGRWSEIAGCLNLLLGFTGFELPAAPRGPAVDIGVDLASTRPGLLRVGDGQGGGTPVNQATTNSSGEAKFKLSGAPQADIIPEQAEPELKTVTLRAESNLENNDLFKDIMSLPWAALDAVGTFGLSLVPTMLSRVRILSHSGTVDVRDWKLDADFEVTAVGAMTLHDGRNVQTSGGCLPTTTIYSSSDHAEVSFASDPVTVSALLLSNPQGNVGDQAVVFTPMGEEFYPMDLGHGVRMFELPVVYSADKSHEEPGVSPMPPLYKAPPSNACGDGGGATSEPPPPDCGVRTYSGTLEVTIPMRRTLHVGGEPITENAWKRCGSPLNFGEPPVAVHLEGCTSPDRSGGAFPSIADIFDTSKTRLEVNGDLTCTSTHPGSQSLVVYTWTLVFCRIVEGEPAC